MNKEFDLEEAEEFIDNIYQHKFDNMEEILEDGTNIVHLGWLDDIKFTDFESASFTLLRGEQMLKQQCKKQKEVIDKAIKYINDNLIISSILDGKKYYTINNYSFDYRELLDILKEVE